MGFASLHRVHALQGVFKKFTFTAPKKFLKMKKKSIYTMARFL